MDNLISLILPFMLGTWLGLIFFGGLWWTVQEGMKVKNPGIWFFISLLLRTGLVIVGFYFAGEGHWERFLACLIGFIVTRTLLMKTLKKTGEVMAIIKGNGHG